MAEEPQKNHKISWIFVCAFCSISFSTKFGSYFTDRIFEFQIWHHFSEISRKMVLKWRQNGAKFEIQKPAEIDSCPI